MMRIFDPVPGYEPELPFGLYRDYRNLDEVVSSKGLTYEGDIAVTAAQDGYAVSVGHSNDTGHFVILKHADDLYTYYSNGLEAPKNFSEGDLVECAEYIFESGKLPGQDVSKIYFEVRRSQDGDQVDPNIFFHPYAKMPGVTDPDQANLVVDGVLGQQTWKAWQDALKANRTWNYAGITDGIPGERTWAAIKASLGLLFDETSIDDEETVIIRGLQNKLTDMEFYNGPINGEFTTEFVSALQRSLNAAQYK
jgi:hypothetical protein